MEKEHVLSQLTALRLDSEELVTKQLGFNAEKDKLKAEVASLKKILMKHTMTDTQEELDKKDARIAELTVALQQAETQLEEARSAAAAVADAERSGIPRTKTLIRTVSKSILLGRAHRTEKSGSSLSLSLSGCL